MPGIYQLSTLAGELEIEVSEYVVWMDMAAPKRLGPFRGKKVRSFTVPTV